MFWKDRIRLSNRVMLQKQQEIFIDAWLSANNNTLTGLLWQPECDVLIGDCLLLTQDYQIRADYDDYFFNGFSGIKDTFYRQISTGHHLIYDSSPLAAKTDIRNWNLLPYRSRSSEAWRLDLGVSWDRNETSAKSGAIYYVNSTFERQTVSLLVQKQYGIAIFQVYPKYSWGSWKEYNLLLSTAWQLNQKSLLEFALNPIGSEPDDLDWRLSCSVNLIF